MVNMRWAREAGFSAGFLLALALIPLRALHVQLGSLAALALVVSWFCLFCLFYQFAKHRHS
jgi:uncharacterized membrane protein